MNQNTNTNNNHIIAYLTGELDEKRMNELNKEEEMQEQLKDYKELWDKAEDLSDFEKIDVDADWKKVKNRMGFKQQSKKIPFRKYMLRIASILILAFGMAYLFNALVNQMPNVQQTDYYSEVAGNSQKIVELLDGSIVTLNAGGSIYYNNDFGEVNRDVILEGEAFFDVERNEQLPFKVFVSNSTIEVLGTSFNINSNNEEIFLSVVSGKVAFFETADKLNRIELVKDEMIAYKTKKQNFEEKEQLDVNKLAWRTGQLVFRNSPLNEVFETVASSYNMSLEIKGSVDITEPFTGDFDNSSVEDIAYAIELAAHQPLNIKIKKDKIIIGE